MRDLECETLVRRLEIFEQRELLGVAHRLIVVPNSISLAALSKSGNQKS